MDTASKAALDDEFGTHRDDDVVQQILEKGTVVEGEVSLLSLRHVLIYANDFQQSKGRDGVRNDNQGDFIAH